MTTTGTSDDGASTKRYSLIAAHFCTVLCFVSVPVGVAYALAVLLGINFAENWQGHFFIWAGVAYPAVALISAVGAFSQIRKRKVRDCFVWLLPAVVSLTLCVLSIVFVRLLGQTEI